MSKERARRREARQRDQALRASARAAEVERAERRRSGRRRLTPGSTGRARRFAAPTGRQAGVLARRSRVRRSLLFASLVAVNALVWVIRPDWPSRLAALVVTLLVAPMLTAFVVRRS